MSKCENYLEYLFNLILTTAENKRKANYEFDGKAFWQPIKNQLSDEPLELIKFKKIPKKIVESIMQLPEKYIDGYGKEKMIESNHFLIQQVRIPTTEHLSIRKIMQIALNIGQWKGSSNYNVYEDIDYDSTGLNNIEKYITKDTIKILTEKISYDTMSKIDDYIKSVI